MISWIVIFIMLIGSFLFLLIGVSWPMTITVVVILFKVFGKIPDNGIRRADDGRYYYLKDLDTYPPCSYRPKSGAKPVK